MIVRDGVSVCLVEERGVRQETVWREVGGKVVQVRAVWFTGGPVWTDGTGGNAMEGVAETVAGSVRAAGMR